MGKRGTPIPVRTSCLSWPRRWGAALMRCFRTIWSRHGEFERHGRERAPGEGEQAVPKCRRGARAPAAAARRKRASAAEGLQSRRSAAGESLGGIPCLGCGRSRRLWGRRRDVPVRREECSRPPWGRRRAATRGCCGPAPGSCGGACAKGRGPLKRRLPRRRPRYRGIPAPAPGAARQSAGAVRRESRKGGLPGRAAGAAAR